jgi:hypothetical protein
MRGPRGRGSLLPSSPDHEPLVAAALGDLGIHVQHTLQAAGEVDPRIDPTAHVGSALIDEIGIRWRAVHRADKNALGAEDAPKSAREPGSSTSAQAAKTRTVDVPLATPSRVPEKISKPSICTMQWFPCGVSVALAKSGSGTNSPDARMRGFPACARDSDAAPRGLEYRSAVGAPADEPEQNCRRCRSDETRGFHGDLHSRVYSGSYRVNADQQPPAGRTRLHPSGR